MKAEAIRAIAERFFPYKLDNGCYDSDGRNFGRIKEGTHYSEIVAAITEAVEIARREAIEEAAKVVEEDDFPLDVKHWMGTKRDFGKQLATSIAAAIRALSE